MGNLLTKFLEVPNYSPEQQFLLDNLKYAPFNSIKTSSTKKSIHKAALFQSHDPLKKKGLKLCT